MDYCTPCDTCDSKNAKTLDRSVRVRARERVFIGIFTIPMFSFLFLFQSEGFLGFSPFIENDTSVSIKRHVVINKTTRRFQQNNTSFPTKQHDVFDKTTRRFQQNNTMFSTKQTVGCEEAARAFRQYPLRTMPNKRRRTEKTAKNKIPLI